MQLLSLVTLGLSALHLTTAIPTVDAAAAKKCTAAASTNGTQVPTAAGYWTVYCNTEVEGAHFYATFANIDSHQTCMRTCYQNGKQYQMSLDAIGWAPGEECYCYDEVYGNEAQVGSWAAYYHRKTAPS